MRHFIKKLTRILLPVLVLILCLLIARQILESKKKPKPRSFPPPVTSVQAVRLQKQDYRVEISTRGTVRARTQSVLVPEVSGLVVEVSDDFREGGFFEKGDFLLRIDPRNYEAELAIAEAKLIKARQALAEEEGRTRQARRNWERLNQEGEPSDLVLRKPQLASAKADLVMAEAALERKKLDLERTRITAPYAGRVLSKDVDIGQFVSPGARLAVIYAVDYAEIRLPLTDRQLGFVDIPELYRGESGQEKIEGPPVTLSARIGLGRHSWKGRIVRAEGAIDSKSRQSFVVAQVENPYGKKRPGTPPLKVGQFVEAKIRGRLLKGVFVIPRNVLREEGSVLVVNEEKKLQRRKVDIIWKDARDVVVRRGLKDGELLSVTPVPYAAGGAPVKVEVIKE